MRFLLTSLLLQAAAAGWDDSVLTIISRSGFVAKAVLVILLFFSVVSWAIIADRFFAFRSARRQNGQFYRLFKKSTGTIDLPNTALRYRNSVFARMFLFVYNELSQHARGDANGVTVKTSAVSQQFLDRSTGKHLLIFCWVWMKSARP